MLTLLIHFSCYALTSFHDRSALSHNPLSSSSKTQYSSDDLITLDNTCILSLVPSTRNQSLLCPVDEVGGYRQPYLPLSTSPHAHLLSAVLLPLPGCELLIFPPKSAPIPSIPISVTTPPPTGCSSQKRILSSPLTPSKSRRCFPQNIFLPSPVRDASASPPLSFQDRPLSFCERIHPLQNGQGDFSEVETF